MTRRRSLSGGVRVASVAEVVRLRLDGLAFGGDAVGRESSGRVVFVPGGAPGDLVDVRLTESKRSFARGELATLVEPGPSRVAAPCSVQDRCGGCPWQHVAAPTQHEAKLDIVRRALGRTEAVVLPLIVAPASLGYRTRVRLTLRDTHLGFLGRRSHDLVEITSCIALDPRLDAAVAVARTVLGPHLGSAHVGAEDGHLEGLVAPDGRVHLGLELARVPGPLLAAAETLPGQAGIIGVALRWPRHHRVFGESELEVEPGFFGSAAGFAQANHAQNQILRRLVSDALFADSGDEDLRLLELHAGDGNFSRDLVKRARLCAVESEPRASQRLLENLRRAAPRLPSEPSRWTARNESAERACTLLHAAGERFDLVLLDPPRVGAEELMPLLPALAPRRIVYVSCDPMTLGRDVGILEKHGYRAVSAQPIDMVPHTSHIETVVVLDRVARA